MPEQIMVSVHCLAYNHEKYIRKAIDGFLMQKTNFKFEVLVHDDASTDKTVDIVREYEVKYPDLIKPIYQTENQYSQGNRPGAINLARAKGKYIAICEGDDFWTDENKLQSQVDFMETHPEYALCAHPSLRVDGNGEECAEPFRMLDSDTDVSVEECIKKWMFPTASLLYRKELKPDTIPFAKGAPCGDFPLIIYMGLNGKIRYIDKIMSAYRVISEGSLTQVNFYSTPEKRNSFETRFINMLRQLDEYTNGVYHDVIDAECTKREFAIGCVALDYKKIRDKKYIHLYKKLGLKEKQVLFIKAKLPFIVKIYKKIKKEKNAK